jgi:hypothetical protein
MIRDRELERLEQYAFGLGIKKISYQAPSGDATGAEWVLLENNEVELIFYVSSRQSKRTLVLNFVHELAHHLSWIYRNKIENPKVLDSLNREFERKNGDPTLPKEKRKFIYMTEREDSEYREAIWKEVDISIPIEYLHADIEFDIWYYKKYYLTGHFPTVEQNKRKYQKIRKQYSIR